MSPLDLGAMGRGHGLLGATWLLSAQGGGPWQGDPGEAASPRQAPPRPRPATSWNNTLTQTQGRPSGQLRAPPWLFCELSELHVHAQGTGKHRPATSHALGGAGSNGSHVTGSVGTEPSGACGEAPASVGSMGHSGTVQHRKTGPSGSELPWEQGTPKRAAAAQGPPLAVPWDPPIFF